MTLGFLIGVELSAEQVAREIEESAALSGPELFLQVLPIWLPMALMFGGLLGHAIEGVVGRIRAYRDEERRMGEGAALPWYQFRLRTLLVLMLVVSLSMSWIGVNLRRTMKVSRARQTILDLGGKCSFGRVDLSKTRVSDRDLACFAELRRTESLDLNATSISDAGMVHLQGLLDLETLNLANTQVTDDGLSHLGDLPKLTELSLSGTRIDGSGLRFLTQCPNLEKLNLNGTRVRGAALGYLQGLKHLRKLALMRTKIEDQDLVYLPDLPELRELFLCDTNISVSGLYDLKYYPKLESIALERTRAAKGLGRAPGWILGIGFRVQVPPEP